MNMKNQFSNRCLNWIILVAVLIPIAAIIVFAAVKNYKSNNTNKGNTMEPILKIVIVSDSQSYDVREDWGMSNMEKALKLLAPKKPEIIIMPGDLADLGEYPEAFTLYKELCKEYFPYEPIQIACAGNHDLWSREKSIDFLFNAFAKSWLFLPKTRTTR